jgi:hypothetical protein
VDVPSGAYTIWPVNLDLKEAVLRYATAQLLCKLDDPKTYVFFAWPGLSPEFAFKAVDGNTIEAPHARVTREEGLVYVDQIEPGEQIAIRIRSRRGRSIQIVVLSREQARNAWKATLGGRERLILSPADVFFEPNRLHIRSTSPARLTISVFPKLGRRLPGFTHREEEGVFERYVARVRETFVTAEVQELRDADESVPVRVGKEIALAPVETDFDNAARWSIRVPRTASDAVNNVFLRIRYEGDVARLYAGGRLITDDFYNGTPWEIGLRRIPPQELNRGLELRILPLRQDAPIYLPAGARPAFPPGGEIARLKDVQIVPEYEALIDLKP